MIQKSQNHESNSPAKPTRSYEHQRVERLEFDETNRLFLAPWLPASNRIEQECHETRKESGPFRSQEAMKHIIPLLPFRVFRVFRGPSSKAFVFVVLA